MNLTIHLILSNWIEDYKYNVKLKNFQYDMSGEPIFCDVNLHWIHPMKNYQMVKSVIFLSWAGCKRDTRLNQIHRRRLNPILS